MEAIRDLTKELKDHLKTLNEKFISGDKNKVERSREFFDGFKKDSKIYFNTLDQWYNEAILFITKNKSSVYEAQIVSTKENLELLILHSYYIDVRKRRYVELKRSCLYVFDQLLKELP